MCWMSQICGFNEGTVALASVLRSRRQCMPIAMVLRYRFEEALQRASSLQRRSLDASMMSPTAGPGEPREPPSPMGCASRGFECTKSTVTRSLSL